MKENLQIERAAMLSDRKAPENLATERARSFVAEVLEKSGKEDRRPFFFRFPVWAWSGASIALAACAIALFVVLSPSRSASSMMMNEMNSSHASMATVDSTSLNDSLSLEIQTEDSL